MQSKEPANISIEHSRQFSHHSLETFSEKFMPSFVLLYIMIVHKYLNPYASKVVLSFLISNKPLFKTSVISSNLTFTVARYNYIVHVITK